MSAPLTVLAIPGSLRRGSVNRALLEAAREADALLVSTPEYNSSIPGPLKNALDWASRPYGTATLVAKPAAVIGASPSAFGASWAQAEARKILAASGACVLNEGLSFAKAGERIDAAGRVNADDPVRGELAGLLIKLAELVRTPLEEAAA